MTQLDLSLPDTDAQRRRQRLFASRTRRRQLVADAIHARAVAIHLGDREQDPRVLCPIRSVYYEPGSTVPHLGEWCDWVAGHYGGHNLNRDHRQSRYR